MKNHEDHPTDSNELLDNTKTPSIQRNAGRRAPGSKKSPAARKPDEKAKGTPREVRRTRAGAGTPEAVDASRLAAEGNLLVSVDDTYEMAIIYLYGTFREYAEIHKRVYKADKAPEKEAYGYCTFGESWKKGGVALVWINAAVEKRLAIPTAVHEICHAVDDILAAAGVKDSSGETRAYMVERETRRLLKAFYGIGTHRIVTENKVMEGLT